MEDISLHILDVAENALNAGAKRIEIRIVEESKKDLMKIEIEDNGCGMNEQMVSRVLDPFYTTKTGKRVGLGLPLFAQAAKEAGGNMEIQSHPDRGTKICATFQLSHPDLKPPGDVFETLAILTCAHPDVEFIFDHRRNDTVICQWNNSISVKPTRK